MGGQCPGAPELKGPGERDPKNEQKRKKRKEKEGKTKERTNIFKYPGNTRYITMSLVDDRKYQNQTLVIITQYLKYETNNGELEPPCILFSP